MSTFKNHFNSIFNVLDFKLGSEYRNFHYIFLYVFLKKKKTPCLFSQFPVTYSISNSILLVMIIVFSEMIQALSTVILTSIGSLTRRAFNILISATNFFSAIQDVSIMNLTILPASAHYLIPSGFGIVPLSLQQYPTTQYPNMYLFPRAVIT